VAALRATITFSGLKLSRRRVLEEAHSVKNSKSMGLSTADMESMSYEAYIDEKVKTRAIASVHTLESSTSNFITVDLENSLEGTSISHRPTGFKVFFFPEIPS
jgi:hypothetical protein